MPASPACWPGDRARRTARYSVVDDWWRGWLPVGRRGPSLHDRPGSGEVEAGPQAGPGRKLKRLVDLGVLAEIDTDSFSRKQ
ncbi:hypothetical protein [Streptomyces sp. WMMB303]|uniref:hypothetical protein n=1 Tax=Streptomyces sp. WMMB303 TaxID=3034154 RepID=UPI0023ECCCA2|nr:hypothetical protein [Streptomyces sp. WMMB303]MDF4251177.1 hypothetical protein [Streptomyces sp. WMMB303]